MSLFSQGHALLVGVGADLPNTVEDASGMAEILKDPTRCAYPSEQVTLLTARAATRDVILTALDELAAHTGPDDTAIVYFSGHGYRVSSPFGTMHYLLPYGYDIATLPATAISGLELAQKLLAIPAGKLLLLLDCCHAGGLDNIKTPGAEFTREALPPEALTLLSQGRGHAVIASSRADELSRAGKPYSAFTLALLEALCGVEASTKDGYVRVADLAMYAGNAVPRRTRDSQHPVLNYKGADNFAVAYYAGGEETAKGVPFSLAEAAVEVEPGYFTPIRFIRTEGGAYIEQGATLQIGGNFAGRDMEIHHHHYPAPPTDPLALKLDDLERRYLQGLYAESNAVPLAGDAPPDARHRRQPRLQRIYVDLATTSDPSFEQICDRLDLSPETRRALSGRLRRNFRGEGSSGRADQPTAQDLGMWLASVGGMNEEQREKLEDELNLSLEDLSLAAGPLSAYEAIGQHTQLVLLGDPGSGKSTLTRRMAGVLAAVSLRELPEEERDWSTQLDGAFDRWLLPVRVVLSSWANHLPEDSPGVADDLVAESVRILAQTGKLQDGDLHRRFLARLSAEQPTLLLLLDGLDEVADVEKRKRLLAALRDFCDHYADVPLIVTCRVRPYTGGEHYRLKLPHFELAPLETAAIHAFVERWHRELTWAGFYTPETAGEAQQRLLTAIDDPSRRELREMAATPLLLTMMARLNHSRGLPDGRAELYEEYLKQLLYEWERAKLDEGGRATQLDSLLAQGGVNRASLDRALNGLAYTIHGQDGSRDTVDIPRSALRDAFEAIHPGDEDEKAAWAVRLLRLIDDRSGLIYAVEQGSLYRFSHRTFQEYLAARWLASGRFLDKFRQKLDQEQWREAIFLALGYQISVRSEYDNALAVFFNLLTPTDPSSERDWRRILLLGEAYMRLLGPQRAKEAEQDVVAERGDSHSP
jgi:energy-coupling factor transporter ATP-binding protein EcfA2